MAEIQHGLDPDAKVTHNEIIINRWGVPRQCDVTIRGTFGGCDVLGIIECRDHGRKVDVRMVEEFATKANDLLASLKVLVSRMGFTRGAAKTAEKHGIRLRSLLKPDAGTKGVAVGDYVYARIHNWSRVRVEASFEDGCSPPEPAPLESLTIEGHSLLDWIQREAFTTYACVRDAGWYRLRLAFHRPASLGVEGSTRSVGELNVYLYRKVEVRRRAAFATGPGLVDFDSRLLHVPAGGTVEVTFDILPGFPGWEVVSELPSKAAGLVPMTVDFFGKPPTVPESCFCATDHADVTMEPVDRFDAERRGLS